MCTSICLMSAFSCARSFSLLMRLRSIFSRCASVCLRWSWFVSAISRLSTSLTSDVVSVFTIVKTKKERRNQQCNWFASVFNYQLAIGWRNRRIRSSASGGASAGGCHPQTYGVTVERAVGHWTAHLLVLPSRAARTGQLPALHPPEYHSEICLQ